MEQLNFFASTESPRWFNYSRWDFAKHRHRNKWNQSCTIEIANEDDIGIVEVLDNNKTTADKALI